MRAAAKILFAVYLLLLAWLVLFKLSFNLSTAFDQQIRSLNLIPFTDTSRSNVRQMIYNVVVFIPFGLLLSVNLKRANFWRKLVFVLIVSLAAELMQFVFAIGVTDITDVITNTAGGFLGLLLYEAGKTTINNEKLDRFIVVAGTILLLVCIVFLGILFANNIRFRR